MQVPFLEPAERREHVGAAARSPSTVGCGVVVREIGVHVLVCRVRGSCGCRTIVGAACVWRLGA